MSTHLDELRQYYKDHEAGLAEKYGGKFIVLVGGGILGVYATGPEAHQATIGMDPDLFLIQQVPTIEVG
jgi:hypothetical protein